MGKRTWILIGSVIVLFGALLGGLWLVQGRTTDAVVPAAGLSASHITDLATDALWIDYTGIPTQVVIAWTTVGELNKFHCGQIGAMISRVVSPLQGNPDVCAPDSSVWVVSLYGEFHHKEFTTGLVQVILDRSGRMMAVDSGEMVPASSSGY